MPIYEFECSVCKIRVEVDRSFDEERSAQIPQLQELHGYNLDGYKLPNKRQVSRNCVLPALGQHVYAQVGISNVQL